MPETLKKIAGTTVAFGDVVLLSKERSMDSETDGFERFLGLEHLEPGNLKVRSWGNISDGTTFTNVFRPSQVLFGKRRAYQRKVAVADFSGVCSGDIYVLEPKGDRLLPELLAFICQSEPFYDYVISMSQGGLSPRVNWQALAKYEFVLPPLEEQQRIAEVLQAAELTIKSYRLFGEILSQTRFAHLNQFFKPRFSEGVPLPKVATIASGGTPSKSKSDNWNGELPWASGKDLKVRSLATTELKLTKQGWKAAKIAPAGSTLIVVRGMILAHTFPVTQCAVPIAFNQDLRALIANDGLLPDYVTLWTEWLGPWFLNRTSESSHGTKRLDSAIFEDALVPVPSLEVQQDLIQSQATFLGQGKQIEHRQAQVSQCKAALMRETLEVHE